MKRPFIWWDTDAKRSVVANPSTGQTLRYVKRIAPGELDLPVSPQRTWAHFEYEDRDCRYPILVEWRPALGAGTLGKTVCRIDHVRSAAGWALEGGYASSAHPPFGLWKRVHVAVTTAFCSRPIMDGIGPAPHEVWTNGGWYNGAWTEAVYQFLRPGTEGVLKRLAPWAPPLDAPAPAPWEFVTGTVPDRNVVRAWLSRIIGKTPDLAALESALIWSLPEGLPDPAHCGPHLRTQDNARAIIPVEVLSPEDELKKGTVELRVLYIDRDLICDCLRLINHRPSRLWGSSFQEEISRIEGAGIAARHGDLALQDQPLQIAERQEPFSREEEMVIPRMALWHRLADALTEAWPLWQASTLVLPHRPTSKQMKVEIADGATGVSLPGLARHRSIFSGVVATSLEPHSPGGMATVLEEATEGSAYPIHRDVGWWSIDMEHRSIRNGASNQQIRLVESISDTAWHSSDWWFEYADDEIAYPVFVKRRLSLAGGEGTWEIDHRISAERWRQRVNSATPVPAFGFWQRVNEAMIDALFCWRQLDPMMLQVTIQSEGGWWDGAWRDGFVTKRAGARVRLEQSDDQPVKPILEPLDSAAPPGWLLVEPSDRMVALNLSDDVRAVIGTALKGQVEPMPALCRSDGRAVLIPAYASRRWNYDAREQCHIYEGIGFFIYANEFGAVLCDAGGSTQSFLTFQAEAPQIQFPADRTLVMAEDYPSWRRVSFDLQQSLPLWRGGGGRLREDPDIYAQLQREKQKRYMPRWEDSGISLDLIQPIAVIGGYAGGIYRRDSSVSANVYPR
jgi:hypothetical protein